MRTNTRDIGLNHSAGKGDAPRYEHNENYRERLVYALETTPLLKVENDPAFKRTGPGRFTKTYGRARRPSER